MVSVLENDLGSKFPATSLLFYFRDDIFIYNVLLDLSLKSIYLKKDFLDLSLLKNLNSMFQSGVFFNEEEELH